MIHVIDILAKTTCIMYTLMGLLESFLLFLLYRALQDTDTAIKLKEEWPKGHFRRGKALMGLGVCYLVLRLQYTTCFLLS